MWRGVFQRWQTAAVLACLACSCGGRAQVWQPYAADAESPGLDASAPVADASHDQAVKDVAYDSHELDSDAPPIPPSPAGCHVSHGAKPRWLRRYGDEIRQESFLVLADGDAFVMAGWLYGGAMDVGGALLEVPSDDIYGFLAGVGPGGEHQFSLLAKSIRFSKAAKDESGNILATGWFLGKSDLGCGPIGGDLWSLFVTKISPQGQCVWSRWFNHDGYALDVGVDSEGYVVVIGAFADSVDLGGGPLEADPGGAFVAKFSPAGEHIWSRLVLGADRLAITADDKIVVFGTFRGSTTLAGNSFTSKGEADVFALTLDGAGNEVSAHATGTTETDIVRGGYMTEDGDIYVGYDSVPPNWHSSGLLDRISPTGEIVWTAMQPGASSTGERQVEINRHGESVVTFHYHKGAFGLDAGDLAVDEEMARLVAKYGPDGELRWSAVISCSAGFGGADINDDGTVVVIGQLGGEVGLNDMKVQTVGDLDVFVMAFEP